MLLLLSGGISLKPGPTSNRVSQCFWKPFKNKGLHFLFFNASSTTIIDITESKIDSSLSHSEVEFIGYCIF